MSTHNSLSRPSTSAALSCSRAAESTSSVLGRPLAKTPSSERPKLHNDECEVHPIDPTPQACGVAPVATGGGRERQKEQAKMVEPVEEKSRVMGSIG
jgi:hypothetical protein